MSLFLNVRNPELVAIPGVAKWGAVERGDGGVIAITVAAVYRIRDPQLGETVVIGTQPARVETVVATKDNSLTTITARTI